MNSIKSFFIKNWLPIALCIVFIGGNLYVIHAILTPGNNMNLDYTASKGIVKLAYWLVSTFSMICFSKAFVKKSDYWVRWHIAGAVLFIILIAVLPSLAPWRGVSF